MVTPSQVFWRDMVTRCMRVRACTGVYRRVRACMRVKRERSEDSASLAHSVVTSVIVGILHL